jgi:hypothetical protein
VGMDPSSPELRRLVTPLNAPAEGASTSLIQAAREASTNAFHLAMFAAAGLLLFGAVTNAMGIRNPTVGRAPGVAARPEPAVVPTAEEAPVPEAATAEKPPPCSHGPIPILPPRIAVSDFDLP